MTAAARGADYQRLHAFLARVLRGQIDRHQQVCIKPCSRSTCEGRVESSCRSFRALSFHGGSCAEPCSTFPRPLVPEMLRDTGGAQFRIPHATDRGKHVADAENLRPFPRDLRANGAQGPHDSPVLTMRSGQLCAIRNGCRAFGCRAGPAQGRANEPRTPHGGERARVAGGNVCAAWRTRCWDAGPITARLATSCAGDLGCTPTALVTRLRCREDDGGRGWHGGAPVIAAGTRQVWRGHCHLICHGGNTPARS